MDSYALTASEIINLVLCGVIFLLYSILREQPSNVRVYFRGRLASRCWTFEANEKELLRMGGMDALVFHRIIVFSIKIFAVVTVFGGILVFQVNYFDQLNCHDRSLKVFTIENVKEGSRWLWTYCLGLYIITCSACILLYIEYKNIAKIRRAHLTGSPTNPSHFTVLVHAIPWSSEESYSDSVKKNFTNYYLSHQMVYQPERIEKSMDGASAFVSFKTRYAAAAARHVRLSSNPMLWVTKMAPEPQDVDWSNLDRPFRQFWTRKMGTLVATIAFIFVFLYPMAFVQVLTQLDELEKTYLVQKAFPFLGELLKISICRSTNYDAIFKTRGVGFFTTFVLMYGWISLACEAIQISALFRNLGKRFIQRIRDDSSNETLSFQYHKEVPRLLLFGFLGFICSILAPSILAFVWAYFMLAYFVYRNQIVNVYTSKHDTGGQFWPLVHNTTIFSLIITQITTLGAFGIKRSPVASGFTIPLIICTLIVNEISDY
ncbi:csc1-like protein [Quercus suber]|uniref:Csc1-like protein n=1 Tax=Quercus suber TaxID=58331 RepID=A0AAW0LG42_QUESU